MALSTNEAKRLREAEQIINELYTLMQGAASQNMLNRLYVLHKQEIMNLEKRLDDLEVDMRTTLALARKLQ